MSCKCSCGNALNVFFKKLDESACIPTYAKDGDAGADLYSVEDVEVKSKDSALVSTGIAIELPEGYEAQIRSRSGLAYKNKVFVLNSPGTIDEKFRGTLKVILYNLGNDSFFVKKGDRIAQMVVKPVRQAKFIEVNELSSTDRGVGGFGHTGV